MRVGFIPLDNRPVSYDLVRMTSEISGDVEVLLPDLSLLGGLEKPSDIEGILAWMEQADNIDTFIIALDTIAYGGLVQSRRSNDDLKTILHRLERLKKIIKGKKVLAFSSIMRISNNNVNTEEKPYWEIWGEKIFEYSYNLHRYGFTETDVPKDILEDYQTTRDRNFAVNKFYIEMQNDDYFSELIFSKDDCAEYGLNIVEAYELGQMGGKVKTGADEIPLMLLAKCFDGEVKICPVYTADNQKHLISNYEDISISTCVKNQIEFSGCRVSDENEADVILVVNNFEKYQGEIVMGIPTEPFKGEFIPPKKLFAVSDVRYANGSDNAFVKQLLPYMMGENFLGYGAWNTSANTLGALVSLIKIYFYAVNKGTLNKTALDKVNLTRLLDDWGYQANVRQKLRNSDHKKISALMKPYEKLLQKMYKTKYKINYSFPWNRLFEVRIELI